MNSSSLSAATILGSASERVDAEQQSLALILNLLRHEEANTKLEIERISGLGRAIVADRVATLAEVKLADESEMGVATGGRAPRTIKFNHSAALFLLAHVDQSTIGMGLADLNGKLVFEHHEPSDSVADHQAILSRITALSDWAFEQHSNGRDVWGIGLSVEGPVEQSKDQPFASPSLHFLPSWDGSHFVEGLVAKYEAPVWVRNATQMTTLGELRAGGEQSALDMLFVDLGKEITAGIVCDGRLYRGAQGGAGLIGHISIGEDSVVPCKCGNVGCLEAVAGADAISRSAAKAAQNGQSSELAELLAANGELSPTDVATAAIMGDAFSAELLARSGRHIGTIIAALTNSFNPSLIVLGGPWAQQSDILLAAIREAIYRRTHPLVSRDLKIVRSQMSASATLVGLASSIIDELFAPYPLARWVKHSSPLLHPQIVDSIATTKKSVELRARRLIPPEPLSTSKLASP